MGEGNRRAICTLLTRASFATSFEPSRASRLLVGDCCFRNVRPSALAHHFASSRSSENFGTPDFFALRFSILSFLRRAPFKVVALLAGVQFVGR